MQRIERSLIRESYDVTNLGYNSLRVPLEELTSVWLPAQLAKHDVALGPEAPPLYFVTHSMGGIILRARHLHRLRHARQDIGEAIERLTAHIAGQPLVLAAKAVERQPDQQDHQ